MVMPLGHRVPLTTRIAKFSRRLSNGCLEWTGGLSSSGYAVMQVDYRSRRVTHLVWEAANGAVPGGMYMCHSCDNPKCIELTHLFAGTPVENMRDASKKGRVATGSRLPQAKLTEDQIPEIRRLMKTEPSSVVSALFGVSPRNCRSVANLESWKHVL